MTPPWGSKCTVHINAEMNYWPAETTNLSEYHGPLLRMVTELAENWQPNRAGAVRRNNED